MLLSHLLISILLTLTHGDDCPLFFDPLEVVVKYGDSVSVKCFTEVPHQVLRWEGVNTEINMTEDRSSWTVDEMTDWEMQPSCVVISNETQCLRKLTITIYKTPDSVSISTGDNIMIEGFTYKLQCDVVNVAPVQNLTVKWYKGETLMHNETFNNNITTPVNIASILQITPDRSDDGVQYRCEAELELGAERPQTPPAVTSEPLNILVSSRDECTVLQFNPQRVVVRYGSSVSVDCSTNISHNGIGWEASEGPVPMNRELNLITWTLPSLRRWDIQPICFINYDRTQCERTLPITIYKTPDSVSINTADHTGPMTEGVTYKLQCDVVNVAPVQNLTVKWYKGETLMHKEPFNNKTKTPVNTTSILQITADRSDDGVQYRCEAELELGAEGPQPPPAVTSEPLNIVVYYKPRIYFCYQWAPKIGSTLSLYPTSYYSIVANPSHANISWSRGSSSLNTSIFLDKHDSGEYKITASNEHGASSCIINITVEYAPVFDPMNGNIEVEADSNLTLNCSSSGNPEPHMWWSFKNVNISTGGHYVTLNILKATSTNSGEYICSAMNRFGHKSKTFSVEIKENRAPRHIFAVHIFLVLAALILIILLCLYLWRKRKSSGLYQIQTDQELRPLSNGGPTS